MNFDMSRLRRSDQIVGASAIAFFIFLFFFKWYGVSSNISSFAGVNVNVSKSGWDVFTNSRWIWLITIIVAIGAVIAVGARIQMEMPVKPSVIVAGLGALSTLLVLYRILHHPTATASVGNFHASAGIKIGIWLGLIAAAGVAYGGYLAMQDEGTTFADVREQASGAIGGLGGSSSTATGATGAPVPPPASSAASGSEPLVTPPTYTPPIPPPGASAPPPESSGETPHAP